MDLITQRQLQRTVLARQGLLERSHDTIPGLLSRIAGLQAQYAPTMYTGLWSRLSGFERDNLTRALEDRSVAQGTLVRSTIHLVAAADYWPIAVAIRDVRRAWVLGSQRKLGLTELRAAADRVRRALDEYGGTLTRVQLDAEVGKEAGSYVGLWIDLVRVPPSGTWEHRRANRFAAAEDWLGPDPAMSVADARDHLVRHYLTGFGPASVREIASFCGMNVGHLRPAVERVAIRRFLAEDGTELLDLDGLPLPDEDTPAPPRFIGNWEALLLVHARRSLVLREDDRSRIFSKSMPQSLPTFLVDGQVAGTWRFESGRIELDEWRPIPRQLRAGLDEEAERFATQYL